MTTTNPTPRRDYLTAILPEEQISFCEDPGEGKNRGQNEQKLGKSAILLGFCGNRERASVFAKHNTEGKKTHKGEAFASKTPFIDPLDVLD